MTELVLHILFTALVCWVISYILCAQIENIGRWFYREPNMKWVLGLFLLMFSFLAYPMIREEFFK
jgi:threonine/homoserine/homoserine lactone efflux protein